MNSNPKVVFNFNGEELIIQCLKEDKMKDICKKYSGKLEKSIDSLCFLYGGNIVNYQLSFFEQASQIDKERNEMCILVYDIENGGLKCPKCGEIIKLESTKISEIISSVNDIKNKIDGLKSLIENIVKASQDDSLKNQLNIIIEGFNNVNLSLNKNKTQIENLFNNNNDYISKINNKNIIKGTIEIGSNELNNQILLFNTNINGKFDVFLNNDKKNIIKDQNKRFIDFCPEIIGTYTFDIILYDKLTSLNSFFNECSNITSLDLSNFDTSNVTDMYRMFNKCQKLKEIKGLNNLNTNKVTNMCAMFQNCREIENLDLSHFNTSQVTRMGGMFGGCYKLKEIKGIENFITNNVTDMNSMFGECFVLTYLDLSHFNTSNVTNMKKMFNRCNKLQKVILNNFDTSNVTNMAFMFSECFELKNIEGIKRFNTSNVTEMNSMFNECFVLEDLDLSSFNTSKVTTMKCMFYKCNKLKNLNLLNFVINCDYKEVDRMFKFHREANFKIISKNKELINIYQNFNINISSN